MEVAFELARELESEIWIWRSIEYAPVDSELRDVRKPKLFVTLLL